MRLARLVDESIGVNAKPLHGPIAARNGAVGHRPHQHVGDFRHQGGEVPERIVRGRRLWHGEVRFRLRGMHEIGELHRILDEEDRDVVADQIPVALVGIELDREAADISRRVGGPAFSQHGGEAHEDGRLLAGLCKERRPRVLVQRLVALEEAMRRRTARVHDPLGNALVIEVGNLLAEDEVFEERRSAKPGFEGMLIVGDRHALIGG